MKKIFALLLVSAPVFAQDTTFAKEDPDLKSVSVEIFLENGGESQSLISAIRSYEDGDLVSVVSAGMFSVDMTYTHKYGADGKIMERTESSSGELARLWTYTYKKDGSWKVEGYSYDENGNKSDAPIYVENWNEKSQLSSVGWKLEGYKTVKEYSYDKDGKLVKMEETPDGASKPIFWEDYKYTDAGKLEKKESYSGGVLKEKITYNDRGDKDVIRRYDGDGVIVSKSVYVTTYAELISLGERKMEEASTTYVIKDGLWLKGATLVAKFKYFLKK